MSLALSSAVSTSGSLRPLNLLRDLTSVADLIELCFSATMDRDGRSFLEQMRRNARDTFFLRWAPGVIDSVSLPLSGFVWEDQGRIVGNVSLIPYRQAKRRITLIANVATHPDYRQRSIARQLTQAAMQRARERNSEAWLQVRHDNPEALRLYQSLGFQERARRTNWIFPARAAFSAEVEETALRMQVTQRASADWGKQREWLAAAYPEDLNWFNLRPALPLFGASLWHNLYRLAADVNLFQWSVYQGGRLQGVLASQDNYGSRASLWLALSPQAEPGAVTSLLYWARRMLTEGRSLRLEHPVGPADDELRAVGMQAIRTLIWMQAP